MFNNVINEKKQLFDRWAPNYDILLTTIFYQAVHKRLLTKVELPPKANVLDLGCGTGRLLDRLATQFPDLRGTGLDLSPQMLRVARQKNRHHPRLIFLEGNAESLPFAENQFEAVFNTISFLHYPEPQQVFNQVARVLAPGGRFYLADSILPNSTSKLMSRSLSKINFYNREQREQLGAVAGLRCVDHYYLLGPIVLTIFEKQK